MILRQTNQRRTTRRGAACVEFAIAAPLLILLLLGCVDLGRFVYMDVTLTNSAREGANFGSLHGVAEFGSLQNWATAVTNATVNETTALPVADGDVTVDTTVLTSGIVQVQVTQQFETLITWPGIPTTATMTRRVVMPQTH